MRRTPLRDHENILRRLLVHSAAFNLASSCGRSSVWARFPVIVVQPAELKQDAVDAGLFAGVRTDDDRSRPGAVLVGDPDEHSATQVEHVLRLQNTDTSRDGPERLHDGARVRVVNSLADETFPSRGIGPRLTTLAPLPAQGP
jgi:hypothetical protein